MGKVFADTGYWIAILDRKDGLHKKAKEISQHYNNPHIVTSEMVLAELLNTFSEYGEILRLAAVNLVGKMYKNSKVTIVNQTTEQFQEGLSKYEKYKDKEWSLTDCTSFLIMSKEGICEALSHDHHFEQAGLTPLLRE